MTRFPTPCFAPDNGSGTYALPNDAPENGQAGDADPIRESFEDIADALTARLLADGTKVATANQPMGGFKHTNVAVAAARTDYARASQVADSTLTYGGVAGGTANALTFAPSPAITAYALGQRFFGITGASANTGAVTFNVNSVGAGPGRWPDGTAMRSGDLPANSGIEIAVVDITSPTAPVFHVQTVPRGLLFTTPGHRLSLTTALAVTVSDVTAAGTVYWTPGRHNQTPIFDGSIWRNLPISELSFILDAANHPADNNYDFFADYNSGTPRIVTSPAWTNATTRADALGLDPTYGYLMNNASMTVRLSNNGGTATLAAKAGLYLGTIRTSANGQTEDSLAKRFVWNMFNRMPRAMRVLEATNTWSYSTASYQQANASTANQIAFVRGLNEDAVKADVLAHAASSTGTVRAVSVGIGLDVTNAKSGTAGTIGADSATFRAVTAHYRDFPGLGYHFLAWLEHGTGADTQTWAGDNGTTVTQSGITGEVMA